MNKTTFLTRLKNSRPDVFDKYEYDNIPEDIPNLRRKATFRCIEHGDFELSIKLLLNGKCECPVCSSEDYRKRREDAAMKKVHEVHGETYDYSLLRFTSVDETVEIGCKHHGFFRQKMVSHMRGSKCPKCVKAAERMSFDEFIVRSREIHGDRYDYDQDSFVAYSSPVRISCSRHGWFLQRAGSHVNGMGCRDCAKDISRSTTEQFIDSAKVVHGDRYDYSRSVYLNSKTPIEIICQSHGSFWIRPNGHVSSRMGCQRCWESKGEAALAAELNRLGIRFLKEYKVPGYRYRYDFYLIDDDIYIEFHGKQHYESVEIFGGEKGFFETRKRDSSKKEILDNIGSPLIVLNHKSLNKGTLSQDLINELKRVKWYWFSTNGSVKSFRRTTDVYRYFRIPGNVKVRDLVAEVKRLHPDVQEALSS